MKIAIVHYWFVTWRGGERVIEQLLNLYPQADIYTHVVSQEIQDNHLAGHRVYRTFIARLPRAKQWYQKYLPFMPIALEQLDLSGYDLIISSESGPAKNVISGPDTLHVCYCHSPMRYVWDMYHLYLDSAGKISKFLMRPLMHYLRFADSISANRVDYFIANSAFIARRIRKCYQRTAAIIHPPVEISDFECQSEKQDYYLMLGQLTHYKKADLVVDAFRRNGKRLVVIGEGEQLEALRAGATENIEVLGRQPLEVVKKYLGGAKALIFPGVEDFGIVPLEAMASGTPVIAFARGGALETVVDSVDISKATGVFFEEQSIDAIDAAIERFESLPVPISPQVCRRRAENFSAERFRVEFENFIREHLKAR